MKNLILILILMSGEVFADLSWGPDLIEFSLENGSKTETMLWISGFSYSATAFHHRCSAIAKSENIESKYLIEKLNSAYAGKTISSEEASVILDYELNKDYPCKK